MDRPRILQLLPLSPALDAALAEQLDVSTWWTQDDPAGFLVASGAGIAGVVTSANVGVAPELMAALPDLKVISSRGVGMDRVDLAEAKARGIAVAGSFGTLDDCVADLAMGLVIDVMRQVSASDRFVRAGRWTQGGYPLTTRVSGKRLGLVGFGQIGQVIAKRASGFDMPVRYHSRRPVAGHEAQHEADLHALARWCDVLVLILPGGAATRHIIDAGVLDALGPHSYLVNVARGSVVDQDALIAALVEGRIAGAGLDVFAAEPQVPEALRALDNVVLAPHVGSGTHETRKAMEDLVLDNLLHYFKTGRVLAPA
ncbi:Lactate dehydrogenase [Pseudoxanthomonas sp. GM95]|uniref:2-hydroxyacid dehydrogenase n=1 Tax=Pseudoxanthomonas sp. GM95 TaxID=1881043 RepID=UPI0008AA9569|nr:2-hydroxyacid dehydrogenase [Pseudoxanthomonas sp. GM95]SEM35774.1 Lactate dehydrogenase [Pseudoxanthomonas sp. GM95]